MTSSGLVDMYHVLGLTPEASTYEEAFGGNTPKEVIHYGEKEEAEALAHLDWSQSEQVDFVILGCPHYSLYQVRDLANMLDGKQAKIKFIVETPWNIRDQARVNGDAQKIEAAGGYILSECCPAMNEFWPAGMKVFATDSAKMAHYVPGNHPEFEVHMGSLEQCVEAILTGKWKGRN